MQTPHNDGWIWSSLSRRQWLRWTGLTLFTPGIWGTFRSNSVACTPPPGGEKLRARAIVVGIDNYQGTLATLPQSVAQAVDFTRWLIEKADVQDTDIWLLTSPKPDQPQITNFENTQVVCRNATTTSLKEAVQNISTAAVNPERFYFFFSGHGTARPDNPYSSNGAPSTAVEIARDTILMSDANGIDVMGLQGNISKGNYREQFYFLDACRSTSNLPGLIDPGLPPEVLCPQNAGKFRFLLYSTQPGKEAPANGKLIEQLLAVLSRGEGYCATLEAGRFVIRWNRLKEYFVKLHLFNIQHIRPGDPTPLRPHFDIQPRCEDQDYRNSPCLVDLETIVSRKIEVRVTPTNLMPPAKFEVVRQDQIADSITGDVPPEGNFHFEVGPGNYILNVILKNSTRQTKEIDITNANMMFPVDIRFNIPTPPNPGPSPAGTPMFTANDQGAGELQVTSKSPLAQIQLFNAATGLPVVQKDFRPIAALGGLKVAGLKPGPYQVIFSTQGGSNSLFTNVTGEAISSLEFPDVPPDTHPVSIPPDHNIPSYLPLALQASSGNTQTAFVFAKNEALKNVLQGQTGIRIVLGVGLDNPSPSQETVKRVHLSVGKQIGELQQLPPLGCQIVGVETFAIPRTPGPFRLQIRRETADGIDIAEFAGFLLPGHVSEWIINISGNNRIRLSQFAPPTSSALPDVRDFAVKLHLLERDLHDGPPERPRLLVDELLKMPIREPISRVLAVYLMSQAGDAERTLGLVRELLETMPQLPDGHVAMGTIAEQQGNVDAAAAYYWTALERGLPLLSPLCKDLVQGVQRCHVEHPQRAFLMQVWDAFLPGPLWTAWRPFTG